MPHSQSLWLIGKLYLSALGTVPFWLFMVPTFLASNSLPIVKNWFLGFWADQYKYGLVNVKLFVPPPFIQLRNTCSRTVGEQISWNIRGVHYGRADQRRQYAGRVDIRCYTCSENRAPKVTGLDPQLYI
jgi:hypothetical protein